MPKLVTWNVNSIAIRLERLLGYLARTEPDFVCLQELKCTEEKFPFAQLEAAGYHATMLGQKTYNGVAVLTRRKPEAVFQGFGDDVDDPAARFVGVRLDGVTCFSAYVPNGQAVGTEKYFYKLNWLSRLKDYLGREHRPDEPLVVAGDFNVAPADADVHDPAAWRGKVLCSDPERAALREVTEFGLTDACRQLHATGGHFTWWDYRQLAFPKNEGLRIDLVLATPPLAARLTACEVVRDERKGEKPSDHAPVFVAWE